ncbi:MAG TPA: hypothetical protein VJ985_02285 [Gammaproteobacteria bacterium]|nr:hypothetical protein [Gammaproteobacteria bacterium]
MDEQAQLVDPDSLQMALVSGAVGQLGTRLAGDGGAWLVAAAPVDGSAEWVLAEERREGTDTVWRPARFHGPGDALNAAARLVPPGV